MPRLILSAIAVLLAASAGAQIVRHAPPPGPRPALILDGVTVPAAAETLYLSGQVPDPVAAGGADYGDTQTQTRSVLAKIERLLAGRGYALSDVVKLTVFLTADPKLGGMDFAGFNAGYRAFFGTPRNPNLVARSTVQVAALANPAYRVEIEAVAAKVR